MNKSTWSTKDVVTVAVGSGESAAALVQIVAGLCRRTSKTLALVHVVEPWAPAASILPFDSSNLLWDAISTAGANQRQVASRYLDELAATVGPGVPVVKVVAVGRLVETLCQEAKSLGSSLLVVGACYVDQVNGPRDGFSTALALMSSSPVPVAVVDTRYVKVLFENAAKIMVADDLGPQGERAVQFGAELAIGLGNTELVHVHVNGVREDALRAALSSALTTSHTPADNRIAVDSVFAGLLNSLSLTLRSRLAGTSALLASFGCAYAAFVLTGGVTEKLAVVASDLAPNLVVFGRHQAVHTQPFFIGRAPFKAMLALRLPILIVPEA